MTVDMPSRSHNWQRSVIIIIGVLLSLLVAVYIGKHITTVEQTIGQIGLLGPLISIALQALLGASPLPTEPLTLINGAVFGPFWGALYSWIGYMLAALIEYSIGTHIRQATDFQTQRNRLPFGLERFPADSPWFLILARIVPGYGPKMVGLMGGMYRVPLLRFVWTAAIPNLIGAALFAGGGSQLKGLF
jgi:uncharacterized membrane protein YdjX (TVP38/TMEM64 family)